MITPEVTPRVNGALTHTPLPECVSRDQEWILTNRKHYALLTGTCLVSSRDQELPAALKEAASEGVTWADSSSPVLLPSRSSRDGEV